MEHLQHISIHVIALTNEEYVAVCNFLEKHAKELNHEMSKPEQPGTRHNRTRPEKKDELYDLYATVATGPCLKALQCTMQHLFPDRIDTILDQMATPACIYLGVFNKQESADIFRAIRPEVAEITKQIHQ